MSQEAPAPEARVLSTLNEDGGWSGHGNALNSDGSFRVDKLVAGPARVHVTLAGSSPREKTQETQLAVGERNRVEVHFVGGTAGLEGHVDAQV